MKHYVSQQIYLRGPTDAQKSFNTFGDLHDGFVIIRKGKDHSMCEALVGESVFLPFYLAFTMLMCTLLSFFSAFVVPFIEQTLLMQVTSNRSVCSDPYTAVSEIHG